MPQVWEPVHHSLPENLESKSTSKDVKCVNTYHTSTFLRLAHQLSLCVLGSSCSTTHLKHV